VIHAALFGSRTTNEKIPIGFVVYDGTGSWIKISRVSDIIAIKMKVVTEKEPHLTLLLLEIFHLDLFYIYVQVYVDHVRAAQFQTQNLVFQKDISHEAVIMISEVLFPFWAHPGASTIYPHSKPKWVPL
jgi:hypothetical protein